MLALKHLRQRVIKLTLAHQILDGLVYLVSFIGPILTLPQLYTIWIQKNASGVSVITWVTYSFSAAVWTLYGFVHKDRAIFITSFVWIIINGMVVIGAFIYGRG